MKPSELHSKSEKARESDQHEKALELIDQAIEGYQKNRDYTGLSKAYQSRVLIYKHLFLLKNDKSYANLAKKGAEKSLEVAEENNLNDILSSCYFRLGEIEMLFKNYSKASGNYQKSLDTYSDSKAEKGDYRYHLGEAVYKGGDKDKGKQLMLLGLQEIQTNRDEIDPFLIHVWESGCFIRLAACLLDDELEEAKKYLEKAKKIIDSDDKLVIRKRQWEKLRKQF